MIQLNYPGRDKVKPLTVEQMKVLVSDVNDLITDGCMHGGAITLLQLLISDYENLCHYKACTANIDKKLEAAEKEISNLTIDLNNCWQSLQREYKKNEALIKALNEISKHLNNGMVNTATTLVNLTIENNK